MALSGFPVLEEGINKFMFEASRGWNGAKVRMKGANEGRRQRWREERSEEPREKRRRRKWRFLFLKNRGIRRGLLPWSVSSSVKYTQPTPCVWANGIQFLEGGA